MYLQGNYRNAEEVTQVNSKIENCRNSEDEESPDCLYFKTKERIDVVALAKQVRILCINRISYAVVLDG